MWSRHSLRIDPISRSTKPFCQGEAGAIGLSRMPMARNRRFTALRFNLPQPGVSIIRAAPLLTFVLSAYSILRVDYRDVAAKIALPIFDLSICKSLVTDQWTLLTPEVSPLRSMVKVKGVELPSLPSCCWKGLEEEWMPNVGGTATSSFMPGHPPVRSIAAFRIPR